MDDVVVEVFSVDAVEVFSVVVGSVVVGSGVGLQQSRRCSR